MAGRTEQGFTLPELLVGLVVGLIVVAGAVTVISFAVRAQPQSSERAQQIQAGRTMVERLVRELRQGEQVFTASPAGLSFLTYVNSATCGGASSSTAILCRVTYTCGATSCSRTERPPDNTGTGRTAIIADGITGPNVFTYDGPSTSPTYVGVRLVFPAADGSETITLDDGAALRNYFSEAQS